MTLTGGVEHSDVLPAVPEDLRPGNVFKDSALKQEDDAAKSSASFDNRRFAKSDWYKVPSWLAGTWPRQTVVRYYRLDYKTGAEDKTPVTHPDVTVSDFGYLPDSKGDIWDSVLRMDTVHSDFGPALGYSHISSNKIVNTLDNQVMMETKGTLTVVNKRTNKIMSTHQVEAIRTFTLVHDGAIVEDSSQKDFDEDGHPLFLEKMRSASTRSAAFRSDKGIADKHLVWLFGQFLLYNYWNDLVPGYYPASGSDAGSR